MMITNNNCQRYRRGHFCPFRSSYCLLPIAHPSGGTAPVGCVGPTLSQRRWFEEVSQELLPHFFPSSMMMLIHCYLSVCRSLYPNRLFYCSSSIHRSIDSTSVSALCSFRIFTQRRRRLFRWHLLNHPFSSLRTMSPLMG